MHFRASERIGIETLHILLLHLNKWKSFHSVFSTFLCVTQTKRCQKLKVFGRLFCCCFQCKTASEELDTSLMLFQNKFIMLSVPLCPLTQRPCLLISQVTFSSSCFSTLGLNLRIKSNFIQVCIELEKKISWLYCIKYVRQHYQNLHAVITCWKAI